MGDQIKSGKEMLDKFFDVVDEIPGVEEDIANLLKRLYEDNKLATSTNLSNALDEMRKEKNHD